MHSKYALILLAATSAAAQTVDTPYAEFLAAKSATASCPLTSPYSFDFLAKNLLGMMSGHARP